MPRCVAAAAAAALLLTASPAPAYDLVAWADAALNAPELPYLKTDPAAWHTAVLARDLSDPVAVATLVNGAIVVAERGGRVRLWEGSAFREVHGLPSGTITDMAATPDGALLLGVVDGTRFWLVHWRLAGDRALDPVSLFEAEVPKDAPRIGGKVRTGPDGLIYVAFGDMGDGGRAQDFNDLAGKVLRLRQDGGIPEDNPFAGRSGARPEIYTLGHRSPAGLAVGEGGLWLVERGPDWYDAPGGGDEVDRLVAGGNYGWPRYHHLATATGFTPPVVQFTPPVGPADAIFYGGRGIAAWRGDLLIACARGEALLRLHFEGGRIVGRETLEWTRHGRFTGLAEAPDGAIVATTAGTNQGGGTTGYLIRLAPSPGAAAENPNG